MEQDRLSESRCLKKERVPFGGFKGDFVRTNSEVGRLLKYLASADRQFWHSDPGHNLPNWE